MAKKNKIEIDVSVDDKGTTKKVGLGAKNASKGLDNVGTSARTADRNLKGAAQTSSNTTKNFSKMAQGTGGLVAAYATLAANIFAISAAYGFLKRAGDLVALTKGQEAYAYKTGRSMKLLTSRMQEATGGLLGFDEASQAAAIGTAAGISSDQLQGLAKIAKNASVALGRDLTDSFNRLTKGAIKAEPELLDELGIVLRLEKASKDYARALGKNAEDLTTFEKSQAVVNAVLEQGNEKFDDVGDNVNQVARLGKSFDDLVKKLMKFLEPAATFISGALADNVEALAAAFGLLGLSITRALAPAAPQMASIASMAEHSKQALMGAAGSGVTGQKIAGGDFSAGNLNALDKGAGLKSGNSTVIDQMKMTEKEAKRHTAVIRADHARMVAANTRGFGSYYANFIAYLKGMEAEHGKTMGRIKAAGAVMAAGLGKVLNAVAIIGMISLAITMVKEFIEYFKDPALKKMEANSKALSASYREQNEEIAEMVANLELSDVFSKRLTQQANMLSNQSFPAIKAMAESLKEATQTTTDSYTMGPLGTRGTSSTITSNVTSPVTDTNLDAIQQATSSFRTQLDLLTQYGVTSEAVTAQREKVLGIEQALAIIQNKAKVTEIVEEGGSEEAASRALEDYNSALNFLKENLADTRAGASELSTVLAPDAAAIADIGEATKAFEMFREELNHTSSSYNSMIGFGERFSSQLEQLSKKSGDKTMGEALTAAELASFQTYLNISDEDLENKLKGITLDRARELIAEKIAGIRKAENTIEKGILTTKKTHLTNLKGASKVETAILNAKHKVSNIDAEIAKAQQKINNEKGMGVKQDSTAIGIQKENILVLKAQKALEEELVTIKENQKEAANEIHRLNTSSELRKGAEALLSLEEKRTSLAQQRADIEQKNNDRALSRASRDFKNSSPFSSFFQEKFDADQALQQALDEEKGKKIRINAEFDMKEKLIEMEYELLDAKLALLAEELRMKAKDTKNYNPEQRTSFTNMAGNIDSQRAGLPGIEREALAINKLLRSSSLEDLADNIDKLRDAKDDLGDINQLTTAISNSLVSGLGNAFQSMIDGTKSAKQAFADMAKSMLTMISRMIIEMMVLRMVGSFLFGPSPTDAGMTDFSSGYNVAAIARNGGVFSNGAKVSGYATGGVAKGSTSGYPAILHGTEAVVPLPNGKSIPVEMKDSGATNNNIVVNVSTDGQTSKTESTGPDMDKLGGAIAQAVQAELQNQKRSGGILNPYGVA